MNEQARSLAVGYSFGTSVLLCAWLGANASLILFANRSTGSWVRAEVDASGADGPVAVANIFQLGTFSTARDFYKSGAHATAVVTGLCTGAMPYAQMAAYALAWFVPLRPHRRGWALSALLLFVRWQRMLTMAALLLAVALKIDVDVGVAKISVKSIFGWGTFAFELANCASYAVAVSLCALHDQDALNRGETMTMGAVGNAPKALAFEERESVAYRLYARKAGGCAKLAGVAAVFAGYVAITVFALLRNAIRFTVRGVAANLVKERRRRFSVFKMALALAGSTDRLESKVVWTWWLGALTLAAPVLAALALTFLFLLPLAPRWRALVYVAALHLHCVASADVLWVVLAEFTADVGVISDWIINGQAPVLCEKKIPSDTKYSGCAVVTGYGLSGLFALAGYTAMNLGLFFYVFATLHRQALPAALQRCVPQLRDASENTAEARNPTAEARNPLLDAGDLSIE
ncbi:hypothetical protein M885DRAFT_509423 [Pelagophyceae sp. CCMP2097]|nr:hypothetical protein M885DRAFT_509423 [Pelagophyceae sp. CCMP2097]